MATRIKFFNQSKTLVIMLTLCSLLSAVAVASPRVNTGEGTQLSLPNETQIQRAAKEAKLPKNLDIPREWVPFINPSFEEFWTEGNHKPDAGFILFARELSVETAKLWLLRAEIKARYLEKMLPLVEKAQMELVRDGYMKDRYDVVKNTIADLNKPRKSKPTAIKKTGLAELQTFFLFSPSCPHCKALAGTLVGFTNVLPLQATEGELHHWQGLPKSEYATPETLATYAPGKAVPVLVLHDPKTNKVVTLTGNQDQGAILQGAARLIQSRGDK